MVSRNNKSSFKIIFFFILLGLVGIAYFLLYNDTKEPMISLSPVIKEDMQISPKVLFKLEVEDEQSGLDYVTIRLYRDTQSMLFFEKKFTHKAKKFEHEFTLEKAKLPDGKFILEVDTKDASYANWFNGNTNKFALELEIDSQAPKIAFLSSTPSLRRGGSGLVLYNTSDDVVKTGIMVEDVFFPAYKDAKNENYICLFPFPYYLNASNYVPMIMAEDAAGNVTSSRLLVNLTNRVFPDDTVKLSDSFFKLKEEEINKIAPGEGTVVEKYLRANNEIRKENSEMIKEIANNTHPSFYFTETFTRQPRSALRADFGDSRTYTYNGKEIDYQYHTGLDLASVAQDITTASNKGKVIYTGYLGIYGNTVIVDHGRNLFSLYSHLTDIHVKVGDTVERNHDLGTTGVSGLAVGDHVHFSFYIGGIPVQPAEWLDPKWVRNNITSRMK